MTGDLRCKASADHLADTENHGKRMGIHFEFLERAQFEKFLFVYIGRDDNLLYSILRPGSIVKVDTREKSLLAGKWANEHE